MKIIFTWIRCAACHAGAPLAALCLTPGCVILSSSRHVQGYAHMADPAMAESGPVVDNTFITGTGIEYVATRGCQLRCIRSLGGWAAACPSPSCTLRAAAAACHREEPTRENAFQAILAGTDSDAQATLWLKKVRASFAGCFLRSHTGTPAPHHHVAAAMLVPPNSFCSTKMTG